MKEYLPHQSRVVLEKADIDEKIGRLSTFLETITFRSLPDSDQELLIKQLGVMVQYSTILSQRIGNFTHNV